MDRLGLEFISVLGLPPVEFVRLAAELGVRRIGIAPSPITANPHDFAPWDLRRNPALAAAFKAALDENRMALSLGEGFLIMPGTDIADAEPMLDLMAQLGAPMVNAVCIEQDRARASAEFARFAQMAAQRAMVPLLEFMPMMWPATLDEALAFVTAASEAGQAKLLIDVMHLCRSGATPDDVARIDPAMIGYVQLCDVPMPARSDDYGEEARHDRLCPGEGDLPLAALLRALPQDVTVGLEVPSLPKARAGQTLRQALTPCIGRARALLGEGGFSPA